LAGTTQCNCTVRVRASRPCRTRQYACILQKYLPFVKSSSLQGQKLFLWRSILKKAGLSHCSQQCFSLYPESQCVWERSEAKKTSQISLYSGCKILERGCLDPSLARQEP